MNEREKYMCVSVCVWGELERLDKLYFFNNKKKTSKQARITTTTIKDFVCVCV